MSRKSESPVVFLQRIARKVLFLSSAMPDIKPMAKALEQVKAHTRAGKPVTAHTRVTPSFHVSRYSPEDADEYIDSHHSHFGAAKKRMMDIHKENADHSPMVHHHKHGILAFPHADTGKPTTTPAYKRGRESAPAEHKDNWSDGDSERPRASPKTGGTPVVTPASETHESHRLLGYARGAHKSANDVKAGSARASGIQFSKEAAEDTDWATGNQTIAAHEKAEGSHQEAMRHHQNFANEHKGQTLNGDGHVSDQAHRVAAQCHTWAAAGHREIADRMLKEK